MTTEAIDVRTDPLASAAPPESVGDAYRLIEKDEAVAPVDGGEIPSVPARSGG